MRWFLILLLLATSASAQMVGQPPISQSTVGGPGGINGMTRNADNATLPTARTNLGLGTASSPQFSALGLGGAAGSAGTLTAVGGVNAAGGFTISPRTIGSCGMGAAAIPSTSAYTAQTPVVTEFYYDEIFIPANVTVTGVAVYNSGTISGNMKVGLADSAGNILKTSVSTAMSGTSAYQRVAFTGGTYAAVGPATYYVLVFYDNTTVRPWTLTAGSCGGGKITGQVYATGFTNFTPATTFTTALFPVAALY